MEIEIKREMSGRSISIKADIHPGKLESVIVEINNAIAVFEVNKKNKMAPTQHARRKGDVR